MITKIERQRRTILPLNTPITIKVINHENIHGVVHWMRATMYGECPSCKSTHNTQVRGWNKLQCKNCGNTWKY